MTSYKKALHTFALNIAGKSKNVPSEFVTGLFAAFGWDAPQGTLDHVVEFADEKHKLACWWKDRKVVIAVQKPYVMLSMAWPEMLRVCLELEELPRYVIFTNCREIQLYDTKNASREEPLLSIEVEALPKYSEAFGFLTKQWDAKQGIKPIVNVATISKEVASYVGRFYRSLIKEGVEQHDAVAFTLQCITAMFAEDIGLLPKDALTLRLYEVQDNDKTVREVLEDLFGQMSTPATGPREIRYFNGGLFSKPVVLDLTEAQLKALTKAAEADWSHVDPHIFGSVFQSIMSDAERHATGAHYTAREDIMLVVGPTIVEPWRKRIQEANSLTALKELRQELGEFKVLDPACGSGNFLYVAYRELYRLETELLSRIKHRFPKSHDKISWVTVIKTTNFYGIDINPFAVELARTTLNIAKKIAFEERRELILELYGQTELITDPSLPLDNLNQNISCQDALFTEWPDVDAIVGNPPFLGFSKLRAELGEEYLNRLIDTFKIGAVDLCAYWFYLAHQNLAKGKRAGLIATSGIRVGRARAASLEYIVSNRGVITHAVSSMPWQGQAVVNVSVVNWIKDVSKGSRFLLVEGQQHELKNIHPHLRLMVDTSNAEVISANLEGSSEGVKFMSSEFYIEKAEVPSSEQNILAPISNGKALLTNLLDKPTYCIDLRGYDDIEQAQQAAPFLFGHLKSHLYPFVKDRADKEVEQKEQGKRSNSHYSRWLKVWWQPFDSRLDFIRGPLKNKFRMIVCSNVQTRPIFCFLSTAFVPTNTMQMFAFDDDYSFGIIHSLYHWEWTKALGGRLSERIRYTTKVWKTFPWPQAPTPEQAVEIAEKARALRATRNRLMEENDWHLRQLYQTAEKVGPEHPLNQAQAALDLAVRDAYGHPADQGILEFLLELNQYIAEDQKEGYEVQGPGIPSCMDKDDPRLMSDDCIEPPVIEQ